MSEFLRDFARRFAALDGDTLELLPQLYSDDVVFQDPLHRLQGLPRLREYFAELYGNARDLRLDCYGFDELPGQEGYLRWTLSYRHPRLAGGQLIRVEGCSHLRWRDGRVYQHRDFFDAGSLLYEHLPLLGRVIRWLKGRLA